MIGTRNEPFWRGFYLGAGIGVIIGGALSVLAWVAAWLVGS